ncbi:MAG: DUF6644 family protein [Usitatibacter sp.]
MIPWLLAAVPIVTRKRAGDESNPIEMLSFARAMREDVFLFASVEIAHIAGFVILVGAVVMFDLRILGLSPAISVRALAKHLLTWSLVALLIVVPSGLMMFSAHASELIGNRAFQVKMALLVAAAFNAAIFLTGPFQTVGKWDTLAPAPLGAKASAAASLLIWLSIIACGRLIAYL